MNFLICIYLTHVATRQILAHRRVTGIAEIDPVVTELAGGAPVEIKTAPHVYGYHFVDLGEKMIEIYLERG